jgi:hypothetical protein
MGDDFENFSDKRKCGTSVSPLRHVSQSGMLDSSERGRYVRETDKRLVSEKDRLMPCRMA